MERLRASRGFSRAICDFALSIPLAKAPPVVLKPTLNAVELIAAAWEEAQAERYEAEQLGAALMAERQFDYAMAAD